MRERQPPVLDLARVDVVIFDTDGVVTDTARVHAAAWKCTFDAFLRARAAREGGDTRPFEVHDDYLRYVDGRSRLDGARGFLASRGITLPEGDPDDDPALETVHAIGKRKDAYFLDQVRGHGVAPFRFTVALIRELRRRGVRTAAVSASRNCGEVLTASGVRDMFDVMVDGVEAARLGLPGKPHPALFQEATRRLGVPPLRAAVVEDALAGVEAGRRGGFGLVVGVDRGAQAEALYEHGADVVVSDLEEVRIRGRSGSGPSGPPAAGAGQTEVAYRERSTRHESVVTRVRLLRSV
ncbi:MAG: HAD-IA family hydrolase [Streptosporangiales bacterium]|nr:HAD-IA family hydrolase [Streptosporangiales bacterium]